MGVLEQGAVLENARVACINCPARLVRVAEINPFVFLAQFDLQLGKQDFQGVAGGLKPQPPAVEDNFAGNDFVPKAGVKSVGVKCWEVVCLMA